MPSQNNSLSDVILSLSESSLIKELRELPQLTDEPKFPSFVCFPSNFAKKRYTANEIYGQGFSNSIDLAKLKSIGECLERLCLFNPDKRKFTRSTFKEGKFIDPVEFFCYSENQLTNKDEIIKKLRKTDFLWYPSTELLTGKRKLIPSQLIFLSEKDSEEPIRYEKISTGAAFGKIGSDQAFKSGLFEVIERDSAIPAYLKQIELQKIVRLPEKLDNLVEYLKRYELETHILKTTSDLNIPSIATIVIDKSGIGDAINVGLGAYTNYEIAIERALFESIQCRRGSRINQKLKNKIEKNEIRKMEDRHSYWGNIERIADIMPWIEKSREVSFREIEKQKITLKKAIKNLEIKGHRIYVSDITLPEIRIIGFETLKVIIPSLHPLYIDEKAKALYSKHYGEIKEIDGLKPHPFN